MLSPRLLARMKECGHFASERILHLCHPTLEFVAAVAGKTQIRKFREPAFALWNEVIDHHWITRVRLSSLTIGTAMIVAFPELLPECCRQVRTHAVLQLVGWWKNMPAPMEQRGGMRPAQHKAVSFCT